ncbi:hypothetical protein [Actinoplanes sp. N902-109]|uniref:hypothetical protein n=1 Tax=Actinoplanes sp. (strain N902-109) TaxID=649831 RepID=UPI0003295A65|nr:hypothetical protein [Actinoplanes sp. N902-109]AGL14982.1 hypothetical protein L083_1472 [Actinoplanes sp. N902-109]
MFGNFKHILVALLLAGATTAGVAAAPSHSTTQAGSVHAGITVGGPHTTVTDGDTPWG